MATPNRVDDQLGLPLGRVKISSEARRAGWKAEDEMIEQWRTYLRAVGPEVVLQYRSGELSETPTEILNSHLDRIVEQMRKTTFDTLIEEELEQDAKKRQLSAP